MAVDLPAVLDVVRARTGARSVRVVDGALGAVVAVSGDPATDDPQDGPSAVARLLQDTVDTWSRAGDACVTTPGSVHLLRAVAGAPGAFVHLRLPAGPGAPAGRAAVDAAVDRARHTLAEPALHDAVRSALHDPTPRGDAAGVRPPAPARLGALRPVVLPRPPGGVADPVRAVPPAPPSPVPPPPVQPPSVQPPSVRPASVQPPPAPPSPAPRVAAPSPAPRVAASPTPLDPSPPPVAAPGELPALAALAPPVQRDAALATAALAGLSAALPRRTPGRVASGSGTVTGLPRLRWACDQETLRRIVGGLQRLN